jgi:hypothetical protein
MRRLAVFFFVAIALLTVEATLNWRVDPFGRFWSPSGLDEAIRSKCLLSQELVGNTYAEYKLAVFNSRPTHVFVIGSSRTVKISARPGEQTFTNMGMPNTTPASLLRVLRAIPRDAPRQTVYLGVEAFWFNPAFRGAAPNAWYDKLKYLVSANTLRATVRSLRRSPWELTRKWRRGAVDRRCIIGKTDLGQAWRLDGSRLYGYELGPHPQDPPPVPFTPDLAAIDFGYYAGFDSLSKQRLDELAQALDLARARGWRVVGFTLPNPTRTLAYLKSNRTVGPRWRAFSRLMPAMFHRRGFEWLDLSDVRSVPCGQTAFADGNFHPDAVCSTAIRNRLDAAARAER